MYDRAKYKQPSDGALPTGEGYAGMVKYDGGSYFVPVGTDGSLSFISRRQSVQGHFPDKSRNVPHLTSVQLPQFAGHVYNVELIFSGHSKTQTESHRQASGILNSLPERAVATQGTIGPIRAVLHNVINPVFSTFEEKYKHMKEVEKAFGKPDVFFVPELHHGKDIDKLVDKTLREGREGVIVTHMTKPEAENIRFKKVHKILYNLRISRIVQEVDKDGKPKLSMGAVEVVDASGNVVGMVGTGFSRAERIEAFNEPEKWIGRLIQVESRGIAAKRLRMPVYNGDADGEIDFVPV